MPPTKRRIVILQYDSTVQTDIPVDAPAVAGYPDLWPESSWNRFQTGLRVRIARSAAQNDGHVLDVESGNATPDQAPGWAIRRLDATGWPAVALYVNRANWQATFDACRGLPIRWWVATLDGNQNPSGPAVPLAVQYCGAAGSGDPCQSAGHYDLSICNPAFFGGWFDMTPQQAQQLQDLWNAIVQGGGSPSGTGGLGWLLVAVSQLLAATNANGTAETPAGGKTVYQLVKAAAPGTGLTAAQAQQLTDVLAALNRIEAALKGA